MSYLKKRREANFLKGLPDAVDVIVRGIKAGLPLFESIKGVAADAPEPLRSEFLAIKLLARRPARSGKFGYYGLRTTAAPFGPTHPAR